MTSLSKEVGDQGFCDNCTKARNKKKRDDWGVGGGGGQKFTSLRDDPKGDFKNFQGFEIYCLPFIKKVAFATCKGHLYSYSKGSL
jgi:hypothetical protein